MRTEELDQLVRQADPARGVTTPSPTSAEGRWRYVQLTRTSPATCRRRHRRRVAGLVAGVGAPVAAVLVVLGLVVVPGSPEPRLAAAAVLREAAAAAGQAQGLPGAGQYEYTETETRYKVEIFVPQAGASTETAVATAEYDETNQAWMGVTGNSHHRITMGAYQFPSPGDEAAWNAAVGPQMDRAFGDRFGQSQTGLQVVDATGLPTDPRKLASVIAQHRIQVNGGASDTLAGRGAVQLESGLPYSVFEGAAALLIGPTKGMTPALAKALFEVMADQPGTTSLATLTAHDGATGQGVATGGGGASVDKVIVDPSTGRLLEASFALPPTSMPTGQSCRPPGQTTTTCVSESATTSVTAPMWTDVVASGVVSSPTATIVPTGTLRPVATRVPGPPTHLVVTRLPDGEGVHLSWRAPAETGTGPVTHYLVYKKQHDGGYTFPSTGDTTAGASSAVTWFITSPGTYFVQAENAEGAGPASAPAKGPLATPAHPLPPSRPGDFIAHGQLSG